MSQAHGNIKAKAITTFLNKGVRPAQEDHLLVDREKGIFVVADGFGGPIPGAEAAKTACEAVRSFLFREAGDLDATLPFVLRAYFSLAGNVLFNSLIHANRKLLALNKSKNVHEKGGASVLAGFIDGDLLAMANVGLCNGWLLRDGQAVQLLTPRSFARLCDPFQGDQREEWSVPLTALGMYEEMEPEIIEYRLKQDDWVLLSTDGLLPNVLEKIKNIQQEKFKIENAIHQVNQALGSEKFKDNVAVSLMIF